MFGMELILQAVFILLAIHVCWAQTPREDRCAAPCSSDAECTVPGQKCVEWCYQSGERSICLPCPQCLNGGVCYRTGDAPPDHLNTACDCLSAFRGATCHRCKASWSSNNGNCYRAFPKRTYAGAKAKCEQFGATLAYAESQGELDSIVSVIQDKITSSSNYQDGGYWIGLFQFTTDNNEKWEVGDSQIDPTVTNWDTANGEPDRANHRCTIINTLNNNKWEDVSCTARFYTVCKITLEVID